MESAEFNPCAAPASSLTQDTDALSRHLVLSFVMLTLLERRRG